MTDYHVHLEAIAWGRAPTYSNGRTAHRILCADGFSVSVQASDRHYSQDSLPGAAIPEAPYWCDRPVEYPWISFEVAYPSTPITGWPEPDDGVTALWAWVPKEQVAALLTEHGGSIGWTTSEDQP